MRTITRQARSSSLELKSGTEPWASMRRKQMGHRRQERDFVRLEKSFNLLVGTLSRGEALHRGQDLRRVFIGRNAS